ncbi:MAG: 50S ribosomal protein L10 [Rickettsiales bacterium]
MPMTRLQKKEMIEATNGRLTSAAIALVVHNKGLTVAQMTQLRRNMRDAGAELKVIKNRLAKLAAKDTPLEGVCEFLNGPSVIATSSDPVSVAKGLVDFAKNNDKLEIVGGSFGSQSLDVEAIEGLAKLPSLDELRAKIVGMLQTPASRIASVVKAPAGQVARVISAHADKG